MYTARNAGGRLLSPRVAGAMASLLAPAPLVRLSLHPRDAHYPALVRHAQHLVERLLADRTARTKADFASEFTAAAHQAGPHSPPPPQCERPQPPYTRAG